MSKASAPRIKWLVEPTFDADGVQATAGLDEQGREVGDPVPLRPPVGLNVSSGDELHEALRRLLVRRDAAFRAAVEAEEFESEEDANDFLVPDELFPPGNEPWEDIFDFPVQEPGSAANGPTLASGAVKGDAPREDGGPPVASTSDRKVSGGFGPDQTLGTPGPRTVETPTDALVVGSSDRRSK